MNYSELMNYQGYLYLNSISESSDSTLVLELDRTIIKGVKENEQTEVSQSDSYGSIDVDESLPIIRLVFDWYIAYSIRNEAYTVGDQYEVYDGKAFCIYSKSRYLDFINVSTIASDFHPGPFKHYGINALNHIIDVGSTEPPTISLIHRI
ncbi:hypothetical protein PU629_19320 [Pullulanibacillus sp. KACC 23026]|uniref:hypothetical protein n=1 Tax=Pullulanibacillus sp. KACC 23026 TaxID=3028315 RepID=UPI0023B12515|nr:hypothetical protein [Pullulanibacillus sp. KACC 23026]WEG12244.1 hypothetical protein PU629_19320 [Pullulanibacillus sp. KACC 23026]